MTPHAGPRRPRLAAPGRALALPLVLGLAALVLAACGIGSPNVALPTPTPPPLERLSGTIEVTRGTVEAALRAEGIGLIRPTTPFRPPEAPELIELPRGVFQAVLPADPAGGLLVVYELPDPAAAWVAAQAQAAWLGSGPGAVQFPPGTRHVVRAIGSTVVVASLKPEAPDPAAAVVLDRLETLGRGAPVPSA
ncbi:MAG: hypothetical protein RL338_1606 [Chloroflexota bacterium]